MKGYGYSERVIVGHKEEDYHRIRAREKRGGTLPYFHKVNCGGIIGKNIDEKKLFNYGDLYYISQMNTDFRNLKNN